MGHDNFPHRGEPSRENAESRQPAPARDWLDRANDIFHFEEAISGKNLPPLDIPAGLIPPAPAPKAAPVTSPVENPASGGGSDGALANVTTGKAGAAAMAGPSVQAGAVASPPAAFPLAPRARDWTGPVQKLDRDAMAEAGYLVPDGPVSKIGEEFRIIKRELLSRIRGNRNHAAIEGGNVMLVTSAHPGDGKTYCSINLALSLAAETGLEILLIDADFAKPGIVDALGLSADKGMMDALADPDIAVEDLVIRTDVPSFFVLPAGRRHEKDSEYIASSRTQDIISALVAGRKDRILIFDTPPLLAASPAAMLAAHMGQAILVVRADRTTESALRDCVDMLKDCDCVQLLLNGVTFSASGRNYGNYYGKEGE